MTLFSAPQNPVIPPVGGEGGFSGVLGRTSYLQKGVPTEMLPPGPGVLTHNWRKVFGDKGYISKEMMHQLWQRGLHLITGIEVT